jgi:hypothetical protein
VEQQKTELI